MPVERRRITRGEWTALAACLALIAALAITGVLNRGRVWANIQLDGDVSVSLEAGDSYGTIGGGPYLDLPAGEYRLRWRIDADGENTLRLACSNDVPITPSRVRTNPDCWEDEVIFTLTDTAHNFSILIDFESGTRLQADDLRLYSPEYTDGAWLAALLLVGGWLLTLLWRRIPGEEDRCILALLLAAAMVMSLPMMAEDIPEAYDTAFHASRIMNLADGLRSGQLPVRVGGFSYNGYGAATSVFYPDLLLCPLALMVLGGASITFVLSVFTVLVNLATAAAMYAAARRLLGDRLSAACAAIVYVCAPYRVKVLYESFMLGQLIAFAVLPLFLLGLWEVCWGEKRRWPLLGVGATLVFQSHMLTTVLCAMMALGAAAVRLRALVREGRLGALAKACAATLLLNLWTLVPFVMLYRSGVNTPVVQFGFLDTALELEEAFMPDGLIGLPLLLGAVLFICLKKPDADELGNRRWQTLRLCALAGTAFAVLSTRLVPWSYVLRLMESVTVFQFAWRFLTCATVLLALCAGAAYARTFGHVRRTAALVLALSLLYAVPQMRELISHFGSMEFGTGANPYMVYPEYQIEGTDVSNTRSRAVLTQGGLEVEDYDKRGTQVTAAVSAQTDAVLSLPLFGFDGYAAEVDGQRMALGLGDNNRLTVFLPAGTSGTLRVWYEGKAIWRVCDVISLATALALLALRLKGREKKNAEHIER